jgi:polyphosphate kinase 2 (PPK2 family)
LVPKDVWKARYEQINDFEKLLTANRVVIRKFFLHISKEEQERRLMKRLLNPTKNWKFSLNDVRERVHWNDYTRAYEDALSRCSTPWAPWYIVPADKKWFRNLISARILVETLEGLDMHWPEPSPEVREIARVAREAGSLPQV